MPAPTIPCCYCSAPFRKDALGTHVKSKHVKEIAQHLLKEYVEDPSSTGTIRRLLNGSIPENMPVYSMVTEGALYYFGVKATMFLDEDSFSQYIKSEPNMTEHQRFLMEVMNHISFKDVIEFRLDEIKNSQEMREAKTKIRRLEDELKETAKQLCDAEDRNQSILRDLRSYQEDANCFQTIEDLKKELESARHFAKKYEKDADNFRKLYREINEDKEHEYHSRLESRSYELMKSNHMIESLNEQLTKLKKENEDIKLRMEAKVNTKVEKILCKDKTAKDKKKKDNNKLLKKLLAEMASNNSDSDSDDD